MKMKFAPVALAALLCGLPAFAQTTSALTPAVVAGLSPAQLATLTNEQWRGLSEAHIAALTPNQVRSLTAVQISVLLLNQVAALTPAQTPSLVNARGLSLAQIGVLSPAAMAGIPGSELVAFSSEQLAAISGPQMDALTPQQLDSVIPRLSNAQIQSLSPARAEALSSQQMDALLGRLSNAQIVGLSAARMGALTREQHMALRPEIIPSLPSAYIVNWVAKNQQPDNLTFTPAQVAALSPAQVLAIGQPVSNLTTAQIAGWGRNHINALSANQVVVLFSRLTQTQALWLNPSQMVNVPPPRSPADPLLQTFRLVTSTGPTYCPSLPDAAILGAMPYALAVSVNTYRAAWDKAAGANCFDGAAPYRMVASCPADAKTGLFNAATGVLNAQRQISSAPPPSLNFSMMGLTSCRVL